MRVDAPELALLRTLDCETRKIMLRSGEGSR